MTDILIHSPFPAQASQGNSVTADRLERILKASGFSVSMEEEIYRGGDAKSMIALNARRSAEAVGDFMAAHPESRIMVVLTGTDINHPEMQEEGSPTRHTMECADALVVLHEEDVEHVPPSLRSKTSCIYPSVQLADGLRHRAGERDVDDLFWVLLAGNLRPVKNPGLVVATARLLPRDTNIRIVSYGDAEEPVADEMRCASEDLVSFDWRGKVDHARLIGEMEQAHVLLNASLQEGGANAICEAITLGLPVVASHIRGNIGMLGRTYDGYFPSDDAHSLAGLLQRCASDPEFYGGLKNQIASRASLFSYNREEESWSDLVRAQLSQ